MKKHNLNKIKKGILISTLAVGLVGCAQQAGGGNKCQAVLCVNYDQVIEEGHHHLCKKDNCLVRSDFEGDIHVHDFCNEQECANIKVTDENHVHDWCKVCDGIQKEPCTFETKQLGNYTIANFMTETDNAYTIDDKVEQWLPHIKTHFKTLADSFSDEFKTKYATQFAKINDENAFKLSSDSGIDFTINRIDEFCEPIFEEIIAKIDTPLNRARFIRYYQALNNEAYKYGYGTYFDTNSNNIEEQESYYKTEKEDVISNWDYIHDEVYLGSIKPIKDIGNDIENGCTQITNEMKTLLKNTNIEETDLILAINIGCNLGSLYALHDYTAKNLSQHKACVVKGKNNLFEAIFNKANEIYEKEQTQEDIGLEK